MSDNMNTDSNAGIADVSHNQTILDNPTLIEMADGDAVTSLLDNRKRNVDSVGGLSEERQSPKRAKVSQLDEGNQASSHPEPEALNQLSERMLEGQASQPSDTTDSNIENDGVSSGLSSPLSYSTGESSVSLQLAEDQICDQEISQTGDLIPVSTPQTTTMSPNMYENMKTSDRHRKQTEIYGDLVSTVSVIQAEDDAGSETAEEPVNEPKKKRPASRKKVPAPPNPKSLRQTIDGAREAWKGQEDAKEKTKDFENRILKSLPKAAPKRSRTVKKPEASKKPQISKQPEAKRNSKPRLSKSEEKSQLRRLATVSSLARWTLQKTLRSQKEKQVPLVVALPVPEVDPDLLKLSEWMTRRENLAHKPEPQGQPDVWAESRQALCETIPYFKSPQSGSYQNDGHVYGFLFDSIGHCREYMDEDIIICRAGGSMEADGVGGMTQRKDHSMSESQVQAVLNDMAHHNPIVVICGDRNVAARCKMPHQYCVLGWYKPTLVWSEKTAGKGGKVWTTIKYRLERLNNHTRPWHAPKDSSPPVESLCELSTKTCNACHSEYPQIYLGGWMCLNDKCERFWKFHGAIEALYGTETVLSYHPAFLSYRSAPWTTDQDKLEIEPAPLRTPVPNVGNAIGDNLTYINTRGICCPNCGRCNSRRLFKGWVCENKGCDFELSTMHQPILPAMLHTPWDTAQTLVRNRKNPSVSLRVEHKYGYKLSIYTFNGISGSFIHASATKPVIQEENGPDAMFASMQTVDMGLERRMFAVKKKKPGETSEKDASPIGVDTGPEAPTAAEGEEESQIDQESVITATGNPEPKPTFAEGDLMTAFSMNYGMPYKFVASGASKPFEEGPWPVSETRRRLNWATKTFLNQPAEDMDLNELLVFAYLESQKLEYHDDGEEGLGPRIATLSLGGKAKMHMRMKSKFYVGCSKTGILTEEKPVAGSLEYEKRLQAWTELQHIKGDSAGYNKRRKELPKELGIFDKRTKKAEDLVTITLSHGDIVIMDGYDIQKYLEHKVVSEGYLRFALTCRTVLENHLKPEERPNYKVKVDEQVYDGLKL